MGAEINYEISQGVKRQYSRARILRRDFVAKVAATLDLGKNLVLGGFLAFNDLQDQIELQGTAIDAEDPLVKEYRSESVFSYKIGSFNHWEKTRDYRANLALQKSNREDTRVQLLQLNYRSSKLHSFDQTLIKSPFADWFCDSWSGEYEGRWFDPEEKWNLGLRGGLSHLSSFTRHPEFDVLITERAVTSGYAEAGISRKFVIWKPVLVTLQGGFSRTGDKYDDYQSQIFRDLTQNRYSAKLGLEWKLNSAHRLLLGYNYGDVQVDVFSPRYLPDHILHKITLGYSETRPDYNWAVQFEYSDKMAQNSGSDYRVWRVVLFTQIMGQGK